jgi:hypothetical protein
MYSEFQPPATWDTEQVIKHFEKRAEQTREKYFKKKEQENKSGSNTDISTTQKSLDQSQ